MKKNAIIYLREPPGELATVQGEFRDAPYLNVHGETERDLRLFLAPDFPLNNRNGQPQYLNQSRYDKAVRTALLNHSIETGIARRVESIYDSGARVVCKSMLIVGMGDVIRGSLVYLLETYLNSLRWRIA